MKVGFLTDLISSIKSNVLLFNQLPFSGTMHDITDDNNAGILIELGATSIINNINMLLSCFDSRSYSYMIKLSVNKIHWDVVIDHKEFQCRSWQHLFFPSVAARYIWLVGTGSTSGAVS